MHDLVFKGSREKNKLYLLAIIIMLTTAGTAEVMRLAVGIDVKLTNLLVIISLFPVPGILVFWYLQPRRHVAIERSNTRTFYKELSAREKIKYVAEMKQALPLHKSEEEAHPNLIKYIHNRLEAFPASSEYSLSPNRDFDSEDKKYSIAKDIFTNKTSLSLFSMSLDSLEKNLIEEIKKDEEAKTNDVSLTKTQRLIENFDSLRYLVTARLSEEISLLNRKGNIYIGLGTTITIGAGLILYFTVQDIVSLYDSESGNAVASLTISDLFSVGARISIVVFIEIFAYYYLRLYQSIREDIKFYQNEVTNIEMKLLSMEFAETDEAKNLVSSELAKVERNFILSKKQTTVELEKRKSDITIMNETSRGLTELVSAIKK